MNTSFAGRAIRLRAAFVASLVLLAIVALQPLRAHADISSEICDLINGFGMGSVSCGVGGSTSTSTTTASSSSTTSVVIPPIVEPTFSFDLFGNGVDFSATVPTANGTTTIGDSISFGSSVLVPFQACKLKIIKIVEGGTASSSDFQIHVGGGSGEISGSPFAGSAQGTVFQNLQADIYTIRETGGPSGYTPTFSGDCDANGTVRLSDSSTRICVITNVFATSTPPVTPPGGGGGETSTSTPPDGGGSTPPGGGGTTPGGGGTTPGGGGSVSNPTTDVSQPSTPATPSNPQVLGESISPESFPGIPNTGAGGNALITFAVLAASVGIALFGARVLWYDRSTWMHSSRQFNRS